jgi:uncharacterized membrane protein
MTARRTPWTTLLIAFVIGLLAGGLLALTTKNTGVNLLGTTIVVPILLVILALIVLVLAWQVRRYAKGKNKKYDIRHATTTLVMAKALEIVGAILTGWYLGQILVVAVHPASDWAKDVLVQCGVAAGAAALDLVAGIIGEWWCTLPPDEGADNPHRKKTQPVSPVTAGTAGRTQA